MAVCCVPASAAFADTGTRETDGSLTYGGHTYEVYQIFTGDATTDSNGVVKISSPKWGVNAKITDGGSIGSEADSTVISALDSVMNQTDAKKLETITNYWDSSTEPYSRTANLSIETGSASDTILIKGLDNGYYLIKDKAGTQNKTGGYNTLFVVKAAQGFLQFKPKGDAASVTKTIKDSDVDTSQNSKSIGDTVTFDLAGHLSSEIESYNTYYYAFKDTLSKGLTADLSSVKVYIKTSADATSRIDVTKYFYKSLTDDTNGEHILRVAIADLKQLVNSTDPSVPAFTSGTQVVVEYNATVNENAVVGAGNTNSATVTYSNDPNYSGTPSTTPPSDNPTDPTPPTDDQGQTLTSESTSSTTNTYTVGLEITKVASGSSTALTGAVFKLEGNGVITTLVTKTSYVEDNANGEYYKLEGDNNYTKVVPDSDEASKLNLKYDQTTKDTSLAAGWKKFIKKEVVNEVTNASNHSISGEVNTSGKIIFNGLGAGTYTLTEVKAPDGYNTIAPVVFTISMDSDHVFTASASSGATGNLFNNAQSVDGVISVSVSDVPSTGLPQTGGIGTTIFYIVGTILVLGAGIALVARRRMSHMAK
jgi:fimbrial isopeptide formation D2 family protein/LPXTG-motif cell wall-anchored protein